MRRLYITFSGARYHGTTRKIVENAQKFGATQPSIIYDDIWITEHPFYTQNQWLWEHPGDRQGVKRGYGWFAWKPVIILHTLEMMDDGDIVLYTDADTYPIHDLSTLYTTCHDEGGIMLFEAMGCDHQHWCKRDCFIAMGQDTDEYRFRLHGAARFMLFEKGPWRPKQFLCEWLAYCLNRNCQTFDPSVISPEHPELTEHRTEQAIMTNLAHRYNIPLHREACDFGNPAILSGMRPNDTYPQLFKQVGVPWPYPPPLPVTGSEFRNVPDAL